MGGPLSAERLAETRRHHGDAPCASGRLEHDECFLLAEVGRLSEENGRLRERIEAALEIEPLAVQEWESWPALEASADAQRLLRQGWTNALAAVHDALSGVPGEAGKE